jgi:hypothetical protein
MLVMVQKITQLVLVRPRPTTIFSEDFRDEGAVDPLVSG